MDTLRFEIGKREDPANGIVDAVSVFANGRDLVDILREVELPSAAREGKSDLAGSYVGLPPEEIFLPSPRLLRITLREDAVVWSDFEQPHRAGSWR